MCFFVIRASLLQLLLIFSPMGCFSQSHLLDKIGIVFSLELAFLLCLLPLYWEDEHKPISSLPMPDTCSTHQGGFVWFSHFQGCYKLRWDAMLAMNMLWFGLKDLFLGSVLVTGSHYYQDWQSIFRHFSVICHHWVTFYDAAGMLSGFTGSHVLCSVFCYMMSHNRRNFDLWQWMKLTTQPFKKSMAVKLATYCVFT